MREGDVVVKKFIVKFNQQRASHQKASNDEDRFKKKNRESEAKKNFRTFLMMRILFTTPFATAHTTP